MNYSLKKFNLKEILASLLVFSAILQIVIRLGPHLRKGLVDFEVYCRYANILLSGNSPYDMGLTGGVPFNYPPSSFLFFVPFAFLPEPAGSLLFTEISIFLFFISAFFLLKQYFINRILIIFLLALLFQNFPLKFTLVLGQANLLVLSFLFLSLYFDHKKRPALAGLFWGASGSLKLTPLTLGIYFLLGKKFSSFWIGITTFLTTNLIVFAFNPESVYYLSNHLPSLFSLTGATTNLYDQSLRAFFIRLGLNQTGVLSTFISLILLILVCGKYINDKSKTKNLILFSQILILTTIGNSFAWQHHFILTFPGFIAATRIALDKKSKIYWLLLVLAAFLVGYHIPNIDLPPSTNPFFISHTLLGAFILFGILFLND